MKQLILLITLTFFYQTAFSQGVGINTTTPDPSAALDIQSSNKGLLVPRVALTSLVDGVTIANPANALLVFNTTNNASLDPGYYYNSGTAATPSWKSLSELTFPFYKASSPAGSAGFQIDNYNGQGNAIAIKGYAAGDGTGVYAQSDNRFALQVEGRLKIFGNTQNPGLGKVLTSDQIGGATWQDVTKLPEVAFSALNTVAMSQIPYNTGKTISFDLEKYDLGNNFDNATSIFTAPLTGIYHFDVQVAFIGDNDNSAVNYSSTLRLINLNTGTLLHNVERIKSPDDGTNTNLISGDVKLLEGNQVLFQLFHDLEDGFIHVKGPESSSSKTFISGRLVIKL
jgi:hypothetical protein